MWKRLFRLSGFKLGLLVTLAFVLFKVVWVVKWTSQESPVANWLNSFENKILDMKFQQMDTPRTEAERRAFQDGAHVVVVAIDEKSVRMPELGLWPWHRIHIARMVEQLERCKVRVIGFDAVFAEPDAARVVPAVQAIRDAFAAREGHSDEFLTYLDKTLVEVNGDLRFAKLLEEQENVVLGYFFFMSDDELAGLDREEVIERGMESIGFGTVGMVKPAPGIDAAAAFRNVKGVRANLDIFTEAVEHYGFFNQAPDFDRIFRRVPMIMSYKRAGEGDDLARSSFFPSLSLKVLSLYYGQPVHLYIHRSAEAEDYLPAHLEIWLGPLGPVGDKHISVPVEEGGDFRLKFYGGEKTFRYISAGDLIRGDEQACRDVEGKIALVGATTTGIYDRRPTPFGHSVPGVELHATAVENVIRRDFLARPYDLGLLEALFMLGLGILLSWFLTRFRLTSGLVVVLVFIAAWLLVDFFIVFPRGFWIHQIAQLSHLMVLFLAIAVYRYATEEREKSKIRHAFQFYLSKDVIDNVLQDTSKLKLGGERRELTVLFSDIRGFTTISEALAPDVLTELLNEYLTPMTELVFDYRGTLDKYMGDAIMAIYGAPVPFEDHARAACYTALEMMAKLAALGEQWRSRGLPEIDIGIGVNTGLMSVGNMGSARRFDYTVMGDNVNLGSRLEGSNKQYGTHIIISQFTRTAIGEHFTCRELDLVAVKGKKEPVRIFELVHSGPRQGERDAWIGRFESALGLYRQRSWAEAEAAFAALAAERGDPPSRIYVERCRQIKTAPPAEGWDGVFRMTTK
ncbi:MAG: adenylate/guanylate cyclase domain-containing protein [Deltaproteobacteria bacterium]|nr:adenylate/guanylate cyclase domain-containing protein [Deltaproteobacteria bacterium]